MGGDYDLPPTLPQNGVDYICFTDRQDLHVSPNGWTIRDVDPILPSDTFRSSREMKTRGTVGWPIIQVQFTSIARCIYAKIHNNCGTI